MLAAKLLSGMGGEDKLYVDDVFSAYTYTGNGSTQTITNGIDLAGKGGLVWTKARGPGTFDHAIVDTRRLYSGIPNKVLMSNRTDNEYAIVESVKSLSSIGYTVGSDGNWNQNNTTFVSWTFRKAPKFFDVQTTTLSTGNATVSFSSLSTLGMVIVKRTDNTGSWYVWHRSLTAGKLLYLEQTAAEATLGHITVSGTTLTLVDGTLDDGNYVCYGFAHDTATDGIIQCGSFTTDGSGTASVNLGWEPQYVMVKKTSGTGNWAVVDASRGFANSSTTSLDALLYPNTSDSEVLRRDPYPLATGFATRGNFFDASSTYIYVAIRRPNKPPTLGTQVYNAIARTGTGAAATVTGVGFAPDLLIASCRNQTPVDKSFVDRLRGPYQYLNTNITGAEGSNATGVLSSFNMDGVSFPSNDIVGSFNYSSWTYINHFFRRAPGVFDEVCDTGTSSAKSISHNLSVTPELIIRKERSAVWGGNWTCQIASLGTNDSLKLNLTDSAIAPGWWGTHSASVFSVTSSGAVNYLAATYVTYLFATLPGVSKVGSYTGNGGTQTINCGFTTGSRFVLIKRTDSTGDWFVWDSTRGIVASNDPHLSLNTTAAEVTTDDSIDPDNSGFIVNQVAATNINVTSATYIFLSFA